MMTKDLEKIILRVNDLIEKNPDLTPELQRELTAHAIQLTMAMVFDIRRIANALSGYTL